MFAQKIVAIAALMSSPAIAGDWKLVEPRDVSIELYKYENERHDSYLDPIDGDLEYGGNFNLDLDVIKRKGYGIYWDNKLFFDQSGRTGRVVHGGWQYDVGVTLLPDDKGCGRFEVFRQHESRHIFEDTRPEHFPVYDRFGVRFRACY